MDDYPDVDLPEGQIEEVKEAVALFDKTGEGAVATADIAPIMKALGRNPSLGTIQEMTHQVDPEGNGTVSFGDFLALMATKLAAVSTEEEVRDAFRRLDEQGAGYVPAADARRVLLRMGERLTEEEVDEILREADVDMDGVVNYDELVNMLMPN